MPAREDGGGGLVDAAGAVTVELRRGVVVATATAWRRTAGRSGRGRSTARRAARRRAACRCVGGGLIGSGLRLAGGLLLLGDLLGLGDRRLGTALLLLLDQVAELGLGVAVLLGVLVLERIGLIGLVLQGGDEVGRLLLLGLEIGLVLGELGGDGRRLVDVAGAVVDGQAVQLVALLGVAVRRSVGEHRAERRVGRIRVLVDSDLRDRHLQLVQLLLLGVHLGLLDRDLLSELVLAVLGGVVLVVELVDLVLDPIELIGDPLDLVLLVADPVGVGGADDDSSDEHRDGCDGPETHQPRAAFGLRLGFLHDGR
ncbi:MAG: hypothetical protein QM733_01740 [Ilumatobacteraceae bacterium]